GYDVRDGLQELLGEEFRVELAMRYQNPSIQDGLDALQQARVGRIIVIPLFPQYASATNGSVADKVMEITRTWQVVPSIQFINQFPDHPSVIDTFAERAQLHMEHEWDHVLFSYHGLPERQIRKASTGYCQLSEKCCSNYGPQNQYCYRAQCFLTSRKIAEALNIPEEKYTVTFQSRLGSDPWVKPYTEDTMITLAEQGAKHLLVFSPAFVADCLETNIELGEALKEDFEALGGEHLQVVESLNDHPRWIAGLQDMVLASVATSEKAALPA
ncbi:MAG: ferrochelatase, partial [Bacteroidota bacterium]